MLQQQSLTQGGPRQFAKHVQALTGTGTATLHTQCPSSQASHSHFFSYARMWPSRKQGPSYSPWTIKPHFKLCPCEDPAVTVKAPEWWLSKSLGAGLCPSDLFGQFQHDQWIKGQDFLDGGWGQLP